MMMIPISIPYCLLRTKVLGRDLIGVAKTGSGKTLAFLLPMLRHIIAQRPLELQRENDALKSQLAEEQDRYEVLQAESEILKSPYKDRQWFTRGALVVVGSMFLGILLTRIEWRRKKKWNQL